MDWTCFRNFGTNLPTKLRLTCLKWLLIYRWCLKTQNRRIHASKRIQFKPFVTEALFGLMRFSFGINFLMCVLTFYSTGWPSMERGRVPQSSGRQTSAVSSIPPQGWECLDAGGCVRLNLGFGSNVMLRWVEYLLDRFLNGRGATASTLRLRSSRLPSAVSTAAGLRWCVSFDFSMESPECERRSESAAVGPGDRCFGVVFLSLACWSWTNLVDPASSHMLVSKIKPCMSQYKLLYGETANGSLKQL